MSYVALRPRLLCSYPGKPPVLTGSREINDLSLDEQNGWRYIFEYCGGNQGRATKRTIEAKLASALGPFDWGNDNLDAPLDLGKFLAEVGKLQTGQRWVALNWAHAQQQGHQIAPDAKSVLLTRPRFVAETYARTPDIAKMEAKAYLVESEIQGAQQLYEAMAKADAEQIRILQQESEIAKARTHVVSVVQARTGPIAGRKPEDLSAWKKLFDWVDSNERGYVSKQQVQSKLAPILGAFKWDDDDDTTALNFKQFVDVMTAEPVERRHLILYWTRTDCPFKIYPLAGGKWRYSEMGNSFTGMDPSSPSFGPLTGAASPTMSRFRL